MFLLSRCIKTCTRLPWLVRSIFDMVGISSPSLSQIHHWFGLQCSAIDFYKGLWYYTCATIWSLTCNMVFLSLRRIKWTFVCHDQTSHSDSRVKNAWAHRHTGKHCWPNFFQQPTRSNLWAKAFSAKGLKPFFSMILGKNVVDMVLVNWEWCE